MLTARINTIERNTPTANDLTVHIDILDEEGNVLAPRKVAMPIDSSEEDVRNEVLAITSAYERDLEIAAQTSAAESNNTKADALKESLEGEVIEP